MTTANAFVCMSKKYCNFNNNNSNKSNAVLIMNFKQVLEDSYINKKVDSTIYKQLSQQLISVY